MTLDASGNLGIGITTPVAGRQLTCYGADSAIGLRTPTSGVGSGDGADITLNSSNQLYITNRETGPIIFETVGTERARIDSSGNLLVGKTSKNNTSGNGFQCEANGTVNVVTASSNASFDTYEIYSTGAGAYRFYVTAGGVINATSTSITAISDQRLKENVRDIDTGLNAIMALKPRRFDWKEGKGQDKKDVAGFIAQEFETVFPECVGTTKAGADGIEYKNINHETLLPTLVKAIQEQQAVIQSLKARLDAANL
jgi:hypothetical protein